MATRKNSGSRKSKSVTDKQLINAMTKMSISMDTEKLETKSFHKNMAEQMVKAMNKTQKKNAYKKIAEYKKV